MALDTTTRVRLRTFGRYAAGSGVAAVLSELAFLVSYGVGAIPLLATVLAWFVGAVPNYLLNRYWAWRHHRSSRSKRELLPYVLIVVTTTVVAALVTTGVDTLAHRWETEHIWRTLLVGGAYLGTYGVMFLLKFVLFDRYVFTGEHHRSATRRTVT